jgi:hypothetical protein
VKQTLSAAFTWSHSLETCKRPQCARPEDFLYCYRVVSDSLLNGYRLDITELRYRPTVNLISLIQCSRQFFKATGQDSAAVRAQCISISAGIYFVKARLEKSASAFYERVGGYGHHQRSLRERQVGHSGCGRQSEAETNRSSD